MVVQGPPRTPPLHRHRQGPVLCPEGIHLCAHRLAGHEAESEAHRPFGHHRFERGPHCRLAACELPGKFTSRVYDVEIVAGPCMVRLLLTMVSQKCVIFMALIFPTLVCGLGWGDWCK